MPICCAEEIPLLGLVDPWWKGWECPGFRYPISKQDDCVPGPSTVAPWEPARKHVAVPEDPAVICQLQL
eukprot:4629156-Amphidinium_carterae.1